MDIRESHVLNLVLILCIAGIGLATFLVADHLGLISGDVCDPDPLVGCKAVNRGPYSTVLGIPWSVIGLAGFVVVFALAYMRQYYSHKDRKFRFIPMILAFSWIGVILVVYLNYLEVAVIHQICPFCAASHIIMVVVTLLVQWWYFFGRFKNETVVQDDA